MLSDRDVFLEAVDAVAAAMAACAKLRPSGSLTARDCLGVLAQLETVRRRLDAVECDVINVLDAQAGPVELGGTLSHALADRLGVSRAEARRRVGAAAELGVRTTLSGQPLAPQLARTAAATRGGRLGAEQVGLIRRFLRELPGWVDGPTRERAEVELVGLGGRFRPEQLARAARVLANVINPDGVYSDFDRARRRGVWLGAQGADGMSPMRGWLTPELRAGLEAVLAKWAAPGMCDPDDQTAVVDATPSPGPARRPAHRRATQPRRAQRGDTRDAGLRTTGHPPRAFGWSREHSHVELALALASSLKPLWQARGRVREGLAWFDAVLADIDALHVEVPATIRAWALADQAVLDNFVNTADTLGQAQQALTIARGIDDPALLARALTACCLIAVWNGPEVARPYFAEAISLARELDDRWRLSQLFGWQALGAAVVAAIPIAARAAAEEGRDLADAIGDGWTSRQCRFCLGMAQLYQGDPAVAVTQFAELVVEAEAAHDEIRRVHSLAYQGLALAWQGDINAARAAADAALEAASELGGLRAR